MSRETNFQDDLDLLECVFDYEIQRFMWIEMCVIGLMGGIKGVGTATLRGRWKAWLIYEFQDVRESVWEVRGPSYQIYPRE